MKRVKNRQISILTLITFFVVTHFVAAEESVYIQVRSAKLRSAPAPWASSIATLSYGDALKKLGGDDAWWNVKTANGQSGYIAASSAIDQPIVLSSSRKVANVSADPSDVVLAGKGFSKQVEASYAKSGKVNYTGVNAMEAVKVSDGEVRQFIKDGQLNLGDTTGGNK